MKSTTISKRHGPYGIPWPVVLAAVHALVDIVTNAQCPNCGSQVVLYVCADCAKSVWPRRGHTPA